MQKKLALSILSLDPQNYQSELDRLGHNIDIVHFDIMDGKFVPNVAMGVETVRSIKTDLPKWTHLMVQNPEREIPKYIEAGSNWITFHIEAVENPTQLIQDLKLKGIKAGIALNPHTSVEKIAKYLTNLDHVLVMTVEPGQGGQKFQANNLEKIRQIRKLNPKIEIAVDGGIGETTLPKVISAGANIFVVGSAIVRSEDPLKVCRELRAQMR